MLCLIDSHCINLLCLIHSHGKVNTFFIYVCFVTDNSMDKLIIAVLDLLIHLIVDIYTKSKDIYK